MSTFRNTPRLEVQQQRSTTGILVYFLACLSIAHLVAGFEPGELTDEPPTGATQLRPHKYMMDQETCMLQLQTCLTRPGHLEEHGRQRVKLLGTTDGEMDPPAAATG